MEGKKDKGGHMRAAVITEFGEPEKIKIVDLPEPVPGPGQVLVKVEASDITPSDTLTVDGGFVSASDPDNPYILGWDLAGTVVRSADGASRFSPGDKVIGWIYRSDEPAEGTQAEYVVIDEGALALAPQNATPAEASILPLNGNTAAQGLDLLDLQPGQTLAVVGAAGIMGGFATEIAKARGVNVLAIAFENDREFLTPRCAEFYATHDNLADDIRAKHPEGIDALFATAPLNPDISSILKPGGIAVSSVDFGSLANRDIKVRGLNASPDGEQLAELVRLVDEKAITLRIAQALPLEEASHAYELASQRGVRGRIVLTNTK